MIQPSGPNLGEFADVGFGGKNTSKEQGGVFSNMEAKVKGLLGK